MKTRLQQWGTWRQPGVRELRRSGSGSTQGKGKGQHLGTPRCTVEQEGSRAVHFSGQMLIFSPRPNLTVLTVPRALQQLPTPQTHPEMVRKASGTEAISTNRNLPPAYNFPNQDLYLGLLQVTKETQFFRA